MIHYQITPASISSGPDTSFKQWVVLVHGLTCTHSDWDSTVDLLKTQVNCLSLDLRGHGRSASLPGPYSIPSLAKDVVAIMQRHHITGALLVGHSMGTRVIAAVHHLQPALIKALVFIDGSQQAKGNAETARQQALTLLADDQIVPEFIESMFSMMFTNNTAVAEKEAIISRAKQTPPPLFRELIGNLLAFDAGQLEPVLEKIQVPLTLMQSTVVDTVRKRTTLARGQMTDYTHLIKQKVPHAEIHIVENTGHFLQLENPALVAEAIKALAK